MKRLLCLFGIIVSMYLPLSKVHAQLNCQLDDPCASKTLEEKVDCYSEVINTCGKARESLSSQISYMNNQIRLTTVRIETIKSLVAKLATEIGDIDAEVQRLESILEKRLALLLHRIPEAYKRQVSSNVGLLLLSSNFSDFLSRAKYLSYLQSLEAQLVFKVKSTQNYYNERKDLRESKKKQQEQAKKQLETQSYQLEVQKRDKNRLLTETQSNETRYIQLLNEARAQITAFKSFVTRFGGASLLSNQTLCNDWGCYYNQRDSQWGSNSLGGSTLSVAEYGCLVNSVAMMATHFGKDIKPSDIASDPSAFFRPDADTALLWKSITIKGVSIQRVSISPTTASIDAELAQGKPVIVGLFSGPGHFIVLKSGSNGSYIMNDPFMEQGHDVNFATRYNLNAIVDVERVIVN